MCGASYAFSAIGALEGAWALANGKLTTLSEQNIIDCSGEENPTNYVTSMVYTGFSLSSCMVSKSVPYGNVGCKRGNMYDAFLYIVANDGVDTSSAYPYQGQVSVCIEMVIH